MSRFGTPIFTITLFLKNPLRASLVRIEFFQITFDFPSNAYVFFVKKFELSFPVFELILFEFRKSKLLLQRLPAYPGVQSFHFWEE